MVKTLFCFLPLHQKLQSLLPYIAFYTHEFLLIILHLKENLKTIYGIDANLTISEDGKYPICMEYDLFRGINEK